MTDLGIVIDNQYVIVQGVHGCKLTLELPLAAVVNCGFR